MITSKKHLKLLVITFIIWGLISYSGCKYWQSDESDKDISNLEKGIITNTPFPNIDFVDLSGNPFQNNNIKEGKVLLVYLLDGCDACSDEVSIIANIQRQSGLDTKIWGIVRESSSQVNNSLGQKTIFPIIVDKEDRLRKELGIKSFPYNLLLKDGIIIKKWIGVKDEETLQNHLKDS